MTRVRIFSLDDSSAAELPLRMRGRPARVEEPEDVPVAPRKREETAVRHHAFLHQTVPPSDPVVRASEARRSGGRSK